MKTSKQYEWTVEDLNQDHDIVNSDFCEVDQVERLAHFLSLKEAHPDWVSVGLVLDIVEDGLIRDRLWAYVDADGNLGELCKAGATSGMKVPSRMVKILRDAQAMAVVK